LSNATINDVAKVAGVSKRTVSRVINNSPLVNVRTREEVERVIQQLNYVPNPQARGLASSRSYLIGLLYDDPNELVIHAVQRGILSVCADSGYELVVHPCDHTAGNLVANVKELVARSKLDGIVILPPLSADEALAAALRKTNIQFVRLSAQPVDASERVVYSSDREVMHNLVRHFVDLGHTDIAIITGPRYRLAAQERLAGFRDGLSKLGMSLPAANLVEGDFTFESGIACARKLLDRKSPPTAIFASNDEMAAGAIHAARELNINVPVNLSVAGYDDSPLASKIVPALTTFRRPNEDMAALAVRKLLACIEGRFEDASSLPAVFTPDLIIRQSSGPAPES